jgi:hypothetical protein
MKIRTLNLNVIHGVHMDPLGLPTELYSMHVPIYTNSGFSVAQCCVTLRYQIRTVPNCVSHCIVQHGATQKPLFV